MATRRMRFPMLLKFFIGCLALAALLVGAGAYLVHRESQMASRPDYLEKHFKRYVGYQEGLGRAMLSVASLIAHDGELVRSLGGGGDPTAAIATRPVAAVAEQMFSDMSGEDALRPSLLVIADADGKLVWRNRDALITEKDDGAAGTLGPIQELIAGRVVFNEVFIHKGRAVILAGAPVRNDRKAVVGAVLIGVDASVPMTEFKEQSDEDPKRQLQLVLVREGAVVASVFPREQWTALATALKPENWLSRKVRGKTQRYVKHKAGGDASDEGGDFDLYQGSAVGFAGREHGKVADLIMLRGRSGAAAREARIPWLEGVIGLLLSLLVATLLAMWITRPIKKFVAQSKAILEGGADLSQRIEVTANDETADLAENINQVFERLHVLASEVQAAAFQVGASSAEISAASKQMMEGLRDQTLKIESSTAAVTELSASIQQVAQNAVEATKVAEKSNHAVTGAVDRMQQIRGAVEEAGEKMQELGESSKRIGNIVEVIRQISEQTSLLALNASIEAAHAGEQGRGFAVVADEVSSLARRVGQSAKDIEALIQTIKEQTTEALRSMQVGTSEVEQGTTLVADTLNDLGQLISVVNDTAAAVQEQAMVSDEIARNMDAVQKIAAEMVVGSEEAVQQGEQLHALAFGLEQSVGGFNIEAAIERPRTGNGKPPAGGRGGDGKQPRKQLTAKSA